MGINIHNIDCMEYMKGLEDNAFELAIVDPPYGIEINKSGRLGHYGGFDFVGCELDEDYFKAAQERIVRETAQLDMF